MGTQERRVRHKASVRQQILAAASEIFAAEGSAALSMRRVAERIEYSPTAIYLYFDDKEALVDAICDDTFAKLDRRLTRLRTREADPLRRLRLGLRTYVAFGLAHPHHYVVTFAGARTDAREFAGSPGARSFAHLPDAVAESMTAGAIRPGDVMATAQALWAAAHGLVMLLVACTGFPFIAKQALVAHTIDTMIAGLTPGAGALPPLEA